MTAQTIRIPSGTSVFADFGADLVAFLEAIADGWRATRDYDRLSAKRGSVSRQQAAREVFRRNFA